jgi:histidine triad (HIT) family protein
MDIFCKIVNGEIPSKKLYEDDMVMVIMDVNPTSNGHCLVIPKKHYQDLFDIDVEILNHIFRIAKDMAKKLEDKLGCDGISLIQNNGISQEVKHFHLHLVPKYSKNKKMDIEDVFHKIVD